MSGKIHKMIGFNTFTTIYQEEKHNAYYDEIKEGNLKIQYKMINPVATATSTNAYTIKYKKSMKVDNSEKSLKAIFREVYVHIEHKNPRGMVI